MIQVIDNFQYKGKKPNFVRDQFETLEAMRQFTEGAIDEGHVAYVKETGERYVFKSTNKNDPVYGKWRQLLSATRGGATSSIPTNPTTGDYYYDLNLGKVLYWDGTNWVQPTATDLDEIKALIDAKVFEAGGVTFDTKPTAGSTNPVTSDGILKAITALQDKTQYVTEEEYNRLLSQGAILDDVEYNIYEE